MKNWARWVLYPVLIISLIWAFFTGVVEPRMEAWVKNNVERLSAENTPFIVKIEDFEIDLSTASLIVDGLRIDPKPELANIMHTITIGSVHINVDTFQLLTQRFQVRAIFVNDLDTIVNLDPILDEPSKPEKLPINKILETINSIPVERVYLMRPQIKLFSEKQNFDVTVAGRMVSARQAKNLVTAKIDLEGISGHFKKTKKIEVAIKTTVQLNQEQLSIVHGEVSTAGAMIRAKGEILKVEDLMLGAPIAYSLQGKINLHDLHQAWGDQLGAEIPPLSGDVESQVMGQWNKDSGFKADLDLKTDAVKVGEFELGQAQVKGQLDNDRMFLEEIQINHLAGRAVIQQSSLQFKKPYQVNGTVVIEGIDMQKLFQSLQLKDIPVEAHVDGRLPCAGTIEPFLFTCYGDITAKDTWVGSDSKKKDSTIVALDQISAKGRARFTEADVQIETQLNIGNDWGRASGTVDFKKGFNFDFSTPELNLANVKNLIDLKWRGKLSLDGNTSGDSNAAILKVKGNTKDFSLEDYYFNQLQTNLSYEKGILALNNTEFNVEGLKAQGRLALDFDAKPRTTIEGDFKIPQLSFPGIRALVDKKIPLPTRMEGRGSGNVKFSGPLDVWKMNIDFTGEATEVAIGPETLGNLQAKIVGTNGNLDFTNVVFTKNNSKINVRGQIENKPQFNLQIQGQQWRLEETDLLSKVGLSLLGSVNFTGEVTGPLERPLVQARGNISETVISDQEVPNSFFTLQVDKEHFQLNANVFGNKIQSDIDIPLRDNRPLKLRVKTLDWNFAQLLAVLSGNLQANEFDSRLTMEMDLKSNNGRLTDLDGTVKAPLLMLRRSTTVLQNTQPIVMDAKNGLINIRSFLLEGPNKTALRLDGDNFRFDNLDLKMRANFDLRILHLFLSFLDDLGGPFDLSAQLRGTLSRPQILGSASFNNAFIKLRGFPHPFEELSSEISFSQNNILLRNLTGVIAGGSLDGSGRIQINSPNDIPVNLKFHLENPQLNIPDKIRTTGIADLTITGNWFPYTLGGEYRVRSGMFEKDFTEENVGVVTNRQSQFLPKVIKESRFEPLLLDLNIDFSSGIQIKNSLVDGSASGTLRVQGVPQSPRLQGKVIATKDSKVIFKDKIFEVQNGVINFTSAEDINPDVYMVATSRVNDYDITLLIQGPAKAINFRITSVPPLPENEIVSLLALGITSSQLEKSVTAQQQSSQTANEVFGAVVSQTFAKGFQNALGVNLQVTSSFDTTKNVSVPKLTASKQLNARTTVQVSHPLSGSQTNELKLQYKLTKNVSAIGSVENRSASEEATTVQNPEKENINIFGLDLEFRKEFK